MKKIALALLAALILTLGLGLNAQAEEFQVAVAANFTKPAEKIAQAFEKKTGHKAILSFGSTGNFYSQIKQEAPFAAFLAADSATPQKLENEKLIKPGSRFTYAKGALALWSKTTGYVDDKGEVLKKNQFKKLAVADPKLAPYGKAAHEALAKLGLEKAVEAKIVTGNNITQTFQFAESGNAELAFIAWSQVCQDGQLTSGSVWNVPADLYSPILQDMVILKPGENSAAVQAFADYVKSDPEARKIILSFGYELSE
ncbi:MAG: molybdate ABC transporter substrate-binding protein [Deltaproteobacteria bacterium]|jgi:molybdate transport system substrate-binding protein|nr:molybdate ABC transporter substrate-binding protein [Deltaproteobacteria bacterium]